MKEFILHHPIGLTISNSLKETDVSSLNRSRTDMGTGWVWYALPAYQDEDAIISVTLGFHLGSLEQIYLSDTNTKYGAGWENWLKKWKFFVPKAYLIGSQTKVFHLAHILGAPYGLVMMQKVVSARQSSGSQPNKSL